MLTIVADKDQIEAYVLAYLLQKKNIQYELLLNTSNISSIKTILLSQQWIPKTLPVKQTEKVGKFFIISKEQIIQHYLPKIKSKQERPSSQILTEIKKRKNNIILLTDYFHISLKLLKGMPLIPNILYSSICHFKDNQPRKYKCVSFARNLEIIPPIGGFYSLKEAKTRKTPLKSAQKRPQLPNSSIGVYINNPNIACKPLLDKVLQEIKYRKGDETQSRNIEKKQSIFFPTFIASSIPQFLLCAKGAFTQFQFFTGIETNFFLSDIFKLANYLSTPSKGSWNNEYLTKRKDVYQKLIHQILTSHDDKLSLCQYFTKFPQIIFNIPEFTWALTQI